MPRRNVETSPEPHSDAVLRLVDRLGMAGLDPRPPALRDLPLSDLPNWLRSEWGREASANFQEQMRRAELLTAYGGACSCCGKRAYRDLPPDQFTAQCPPGWNTRRLSRNDYPASVTIPHPDNPADTVECPIRLRCRWCVASARRHPSGLCAHERSRTYAATPPERRVGEP